MSAKIQVMRSHAVHRVFGHGVQRRWLESTMRGTVKYLFECKIRTTLTETFFGIFPALSILQFWEAHFHLHGCAVSSASPASLSDWHFLICDPLGERRYRSSVF